VQPSPKDKTMQIQCLLKRPTGTQITHNGKEYDFQPNAKGDHVCEIEDAETIHRLVVGIPEAYKIYGNDKLPPVPKKKNHEQSIDLTKQMTNQDGKMVITDGEKEIDLMELDLEALKQLATNDFGITVHHKWKEETIRFKIVEKTRASA
jgi:hypothetical protein